MIVRAENEADIAAIHAVHAGAFPSDAEARLTDALRAGGWLVLGLVAEEDGAVAGHVAFSRLIVQDETGAQQRALALAPVAVQENRRRRGIAQALIEEGHRRLSAAGERMSFVLGDPAYYARCGYDAALAAQYATPYPGPAFQALILNPPALRVGEVIYAPAFALV